MKDKLDPVDAAIAKMVTSELHCETVDKCLQLFGGWGYIGNIRSAVHTPTRELLKSPWFDEVMKTIIARDMFKASPK